MRRIALYGRPGAGKSTFGELLGQELAGAGACALPVRLASPLYELQALVYTVAGRPMLVGTRQDGALLNSLGGHLRRINPGALTDAFAARVRQAEQAHPLAVLVCDDMRAPDVGALTALGFELVEVIAPEQVRRARKAARADLSAGNEEHSTEAPVDAVPWHRVDNAGDLEQLRRLAADLAQRVLR
jgi:hypothetical protein